MQIFVGLFCLLILLIGLDPVFGETPKGLFGETSSKGRIGDLNVEWATYEIPYSGMIQVKMYGTIYDSSTRGQRIQFTITNPDGDVEEGSVTPSNRGYYENILLFDKNDFKGIYEVEAHTHVGDFIGKISFQLYDKNHPLVPLEEPEVSPEKKYEESDCIEITPTSNKGVSVPSWIKDIAGFWTKDMISDEEYLNTINWLIGNEILKVSQTNKFEDVGDFKIEIKKPTKSLYDIYYDDLVTDNVYDKKAQLLNCIFILPEDITIIAEECGSANAYYDRKNKEVVMCYELMYYIDRFSIAQTETFEKKASMFNGILFFTLEHELGHALADVYDLPITGMEEDAVDQLASLLMLQSPQSTAYLVSAEMFFLAHGEFGSKTSELAFWDEHSFNLQRFYNILCLMYGENPDKGSALGLLDLIPVERAVRCEDEFQQSSNSWKNLLEPYTEPGYLEYVFG